MKTISIPYFPTGIKYATPLPLGLAIYLYIIGYPVWTGVLVLLTIIVLTTKYVTEINMDKKEYRDFISFLWIPFEEEKVKFKTVNKIVITKDNHSQMLNSRSRSRQLDWASFTGTLIIDDNKTLDLLTRTDKRELITGLREFVDLLKVEIEDQTTNQPFTIDISKY
jgi:hypothetical protein